MTVRKKREIDKKNQKMIAKSFLTLLYKEKIFRENKPITNVGVKKYNSQYRFNLFYDDHDDWIHGSSYRITIFFKASKEIEVRVLSLRKGLVYNAKIKYPEIILERPKADEISRGIIKDYEMIFDEGISWLNSRFTPLRIRENDVAFYKGYLKELTNWFFKSDSRIKEIEYFNKDKNKKLAKVRFKTDEGAMVIAETPIFNKVCFYLTISSSNKKFLQLEKEMKINKENMPEKINVFNQLKYKRVSKNLLRLYIEFEKIKPYNYENYKIAEIETFRDLFNKETLSIKENYKLFKNNKSYDLVQNIAIN